jgi:hypothetical protein
MTTTGSEHTRSWEQDLAEEGIERVRLQLLHVLLSLGVGEVLR